MAATPNTTHKGLIAITGASSGIGAATAKLFASKGYATLLLARRVAPMEELALPLSISIALDVTDSDAFVKAIDEGEAKFGPVSALINNAGCMMLQRFDLQNPDDVKRMVNVNVFGVINGVSAVIKRMYERKTGTIINISSIAGEKIFPSHAVYCATKFAVTAFTEAVRMEAQEFKVRVTTISPGVVETNLMEGTSSRDETKAIADGYAEWKKGFTMKSVEPEEIATIIAFAVELPQHVCIRNLVVGPTGQKE
eukprot:TRINITY_DN10933_c0_g1_i1.p1 TRINITY_DN10933_c0_g1~~TRINITY_DN10933_c0_g1_i1.p1  ORF type:complete len:253 (-),score=77.93 TRINITY_DN10933_c0_g1_i1:59-817(-)